MRAAIGAAIGALALGEAIDAGIGAIVVRVLFRMLVGAFRMPLKGPAAIAGRHCVLSRDTLIASPVILAVVGLFNLCIMFLLETRGVNNLFKIRIGARQYSL